MDAGILEKTGIFRLGVDHLRHRIHTLLPIAALAWLVNNLPAAGGKNRGEQTYASGSGHSNSFDFSPSYFEHWRSGVINYRKRSAEVSARLDGCPQVAAGQFRPLHN